MEIRYTVLFSTILLSLLLSGCSGSINIWPFDGPKAQDRPRTPPNATEYQCHNAKRFYVRYLDNGNAAWVIYPEREVRLDKVTTDSGTRYSNGIAVLEVNGDVTTLADGPAISFTGCKPTNSQP